MRLVDYSVFLLRPGSLLNLWVQVVVPALAALLPIPGVQVFGDQRPAFHAVLLHQLSDLHRK